jgi:hypothetical protein
MVLRATRKLAPAALGRPVVQAQVLAVRLAEAQRRPVAWVPALHPVPARVRLARRLRPEPGLEQVQVARVRAAHLQAAVLAAYRESAACQPMAPT